MLFSLFQTQDLKNVRDSQTHNSHREVGRSSPNQLLVSSQLHFVHIQSTEGGGEDPNDFGNPYIYKCRFHDRKKFPIPLAPQVSGLCRGMMLEISALQARVAHLEEEKRFLEEQLSLRFKERYDPLVRHLFSTCLQLKVILFSSYRCTYSF